MAVATAARAVDISEALTALQPLDADQYFVAFGPAGRQFCGTPNGYSASQLPARVVKDLLYGDVNKVVWASFGSEEQSYFFAYEMKDGSFGHRVGKNAPSTLRPFVEYASSKPLELAPTLRVQLGANRSYVAWAGGIWASRNVSASLNSALLHLSSNHDEYKPKILKGALKSGGLINVAWHDSGTYYVRADQEDSWSFESDIIKKGWGDLWQEYEKLTPQAMAELAYVGIDPYSSTGETFAFIKKKKDLSDEPHFVVRFEPEEAVARLPSLPIDPAAHIELIAQNGLELETHPPEDLAPCPKGTDSEEARPVVNIVTQTEGIQAFQWACSKRAGRPHTTDSWELDLKKGERLKIIQDLGNNWFMAENQRAVKGYVHRSSLNFGDPRIHADTREAYARYADDVEQLLRPDALRSFVELSSYMNACKKEICKPMKQDRTGLHICVHDLHELMKGSGQYSADFLKTQRNRYHPDKFARYCHPESRDELKAKAEMLFVLFGVLMDWLESPPDDARE